MVPGSDSSPLQAKYLGSPSCLGGIKDHFSPALNPAPPRPRIFAAFTVSITLFGVFSLEVSTLRRVSYPPCLVYTSI